MTPTDRASQAQQPADVLVIFGITGDLARVMTFRSLYRLERRGILGCPIVGVASRDWTIEQLVERARTSIVDPTWHTTLLTSSSVRSAARLAWLTCALAVAIALHGMVTSNK